MMSEGWQSDEFIIEPISFTDMKCKTPQEYPENTSLADSKGLKFFSVAMGLDSAKRKREGSSSSLNIPKTGHRWHHALHKARLLGDSWEKFHLEDYPTEKALRHRYNALKCEWVIDEVLVKMEKTPFAHGSMRECFRIKKLSNFSHNQDWRRDRNNAVAKRYLDMTERDIYFAEVKLQLDAKLWSQEYNRHHPPKQIDICIMGVLEFVDRPGKPLYHVENFIDGPYIKYNSNGGFVLDDEAHRQTPQAFSHFTFERSGHELIVVDIQGVGDLYTDPQIHTVSGTDYGDGNLGTRGMALFFHTHVCNTICHSLGLTSFDLAPSELRALSTYQRQTSVGTVLRGNEELCASPSEYQRTHLHEFLRLRTSSIGSCSSLGGSIDEWPVTDAEDENINVSESVDTGIGFGTFSRLNSESEGSRGSPLPTNGGFSDSPVRYHRRARFISECGSASITDEDDRVAFREQTSKKARASGVHAEVEARKNLLKDSMRDRHPMGGSVLGQVHIDIAKYHELQRFSEPGVEDYDKEAALFHLRAAADCGNLEAVITIARVALDLPHDVLPDLNSAHIEGEVNLINLGLDYMHLAASAGDRAAMVYLGQAYDSGAEDLLGDRARSCQNCWSVAMEWYGRAVAMDTADEEGNYDSTMDYPTYQILARQAEMYREGGGGLERDYSRATELYSEAADMAMVAMKGRLANKYYALAEEVASLVTDE